MQVAKITNKWFDETFSQVKTRNEPLRQLDTLLIGALHCGRKYCNGILALLMNRHKMPAAALLRILCELHVKLLWCLQAPDKTDAPAKDNCYQRFRRWDYLSITQRKKMLKDFSNTSSGRDKLDADKELQQLNANIAKLSNKQLPSMPSIAEICCELSNVLCKDWAKIYPGVYRRLSPAVHLDMALIRDMVHVSEGQVQFFADSPNYYEERQLLLFCITMGCDINLMVRRYYGWDCDGIQSEYNALRQQIKRDEKDDL